MYTEKKEKNNTIQYSTERYDDAHRDYTITQYLSNNLFAAVCTILFSLHIVYSCECVCVNTEHFGGKFFSSLSQ